VGDGTWTYGDDIEGQNFFATAINVTAGKFRVASVINGVIVNVDCTELTQ
jgi:hypothetical protein